MRIAYLAPYQGPTLLQRRPTTLNRSLANRIKSELIATLLQSAAHEVEVISQGEVVENRWTFYPSFSELEPFHPDIPVFYASAMPIRHLNGLWSSRQTLQLFRERHRSSPYDLVIIWNLKHPQITCADHAMRHLGIPVILEYEDDQFVSIIGRANSGLLSRYRAHHGLCQRILKSVAGCIGVSPYLLSQVPSSTPKLLLRGVVGNDVIRASTRNGAARDQMVVFSGTHGAANGVAELIEAWRKAGIPDWELHITGQGELTETLRRMAANVKNLVFHGMLSRQEMVDLISRARICINPHAVSSTPGNVFAFKIIEYIAAGAHVITTPMGELEPEIEKGITYMIDNAPDTIAMSIKHVIRNEAWKRKSTEHVWSRYGCQAVAESLDSLLREVVGSGSRPASVGCSLQ